MLTVVNEYVDRLNKVIGLWIDALNTQNGGSESVLTKYLNNWVVKTIMTGGLEVFNDVFEESGYGKWQNQFFKTTIRHRLDVIFRERARIDEGNLRIRISKESVILWLWNNNIEAITKWINVQGEREERLAFLKEAANDGSIHASLRLSDEDIAFTQGQITQAENSPVVSVSP
jgi:hypothetical protein